MNHDAQHIYNLRAEILQQENEMHRLTAQRDALLAALRRHVELHDGDCICEDCAAIKQAQE